MSAPSGEQPPGSLVQGGGFGQNETEASATQKMSQGVVDATGHARAAFELNIGDLDVGIADLTDGQNAYGNRTDLLEDVGYGTATMSRNWDLPNQSARRLPFDQQVGPSDSVSLTSGVIALRKQGLWRVDAHTTIQGFTRSYVITYATTPGGIIYPIYNYTYWPLVMRYWIEVIGPGSAGPTYTAREFNEVPDLAFQDVNFWTDGGTPAPQTSHFAHTFVLPDTVDYNAASTWFYVRLVAIDRTNVTYGSVDWRVCKSLGGTQQSALCATRWSRDVAFANHPATVPDGGTL